MDKMFRDKKAIAVFILPAVILFIGVLAGPILFAIYISLCNWDAMTKPDFIGLKNYITLFTTDMTALTAIKNTMFFAAFSLVVQQILGLFIAVILSNKKIKGKNIFKNIYYLPCVLSSAAIGLLFSFLFNPGMGVNQVLSKLGINGPLWLSDIRGFIPLPMWVIGMVATWQYMGITMMLYMAAIAGISGSVYEAAYIDGADGFSVFHHITLPLVKPMTKISISLTFIGSLKFFDLIYNMTKGGPNHKTEVLATQIYEQGFKYFKYGYSSAISIVLLVLCLGSTLLVSKCIKTEDYGM